MNHLLTTIARTFVAAATLCAAAATAHAQGVSGDVAAGQKKAEMCVGCHGIPGYQNSFPEIHKVPMISGQSAGYIVSALNAYKKGDRKHPSMRGIAGSLTEQDMADLAAYYASHADKTAPDTPRTASTTAAMKKASRLLACGGYRTPLKAQAKERVQAVAPKRLARFRVSKSGVSAVHAAAVRR